VKGLSIERKLNERQYSAPISFIFLRWLLIRLFYAASSIVEVLWWNHCECWIVKHRPMGEISYGLGTLTVFSWKDWGKSQWLILRTAHAGLLSTCFAKTISFSSMWGCFGSGYVEFYLTPCSPLKVFTFNGLHSVISQEIQVFTKFAECKVQIVCVPTWEAGNSPVQTPFKCVNMNRNLHLLSSWLQYEKSELFCFGWRSRFVRMTESAVMKSANRS
jgi:hypothetical protein